VDCCESARGYEIDGIAWLEAREEVGADDEGSCVRKVDRPRLGARGSRWVGDWQRREWVCWSRCVDCQDVVYVDAVVAEVAHGHVLD
jgi:hypothetical protein